MLIKFIFEHAKIFIHSLFMHSPHVNFHTFPTREFSYIPFSCIPLTWTFIHFLFIHSPHKKVFIRSPHEKVFIHSPHVNFHTFPFHTFPSCEFSYFPFSYIPHTWIFTHSLFIHSPHVNFHTFRFHTFPTRESFHTFPLHLQLHIHWIGRGALPGRGWESVPLPACLATGKSNRKDGHNRLQRERKEAKHLPKQRVYETTICYIREPKLWKHQKNHSV